MTSPSKTPQKARESRGTALAHARETASSTPAALVDAQELARYLAVDVSYVYAHADELGARRLGSGPKARLRFSVSEVDQRLTSCVSSRESEVAVSGAVEPKPRRRRPLSSGSTVPLLPVRGAS